MFEKEGKLLPILVFLTFYLLYIDVSQIRNHTDFKKGCWSQTLGVSNKNTFNFPI